MNNLSANVIQLAAVQTISSAELLERRTAAVHGEHAFNVAGPTAYLRMM